MQRRFQIGEQIGEYRVTRFLGAGGMGEVYQGEHTKLGRLAAIKILGQAATDPSFVTRFFNEARLQASLHHPNVASLYDFQEINGQLCIFMEFVDGESLEDLVQRRAFTVGDAVETFRHIVEAIAYIHSHGIVHRDIKAANVKVSSQGTVKMLDFGIAKGESSQQLTMVGGVIGTPQYLAPEQLQDEPASARTDVWALGVLFYEMLTGVVPFTDDNLSALCRKISSAEFVPIGNLNPAVPREVERLVVRCLKRNPSERYQTADELLADVRRVGGKINSTNKVESGGAFGFIKTAIGSTASAPVEAQNAVSAFALSDSGQAQYSYDSQNSQPDSSYQVYSSGENYTNASAGANSARRGLPLLLIAGVSAVAVLLLFGVAGAIVYFVFARGNSTPTVAGGNSTVANTQIRGNQAVVIGSSRQIQIDVDEGRAQVLQNGRSLGTTPLPITVRDGERVDLTLKREGYEDKAVQLEPSGSKRVYTFSLKQK